MTIALTIIGTVAVVAAIALGLFVYWIKKVGTLIK